MKMTLASKRVCGHTPSVGGGIVAKMPDTELDMYEIPKLPATFGHPTNSVHIYK